MSSVIVDHHPRSSSSLAQYYLTDFWTEVGDPRVVQLPLMSSFSIPLFIFAVYLLFVLYLGPWLMRKREPMSLRSLIIPYNLAMSLINAYFFVQVLLESNFGRRLLEVDWKERTDTGPQIMTQRNICWFYLLSKYVDLLDTVFFVLRKKQNQITGKCRF